MTEAELEALAAAALAARAGAYAPYSRFAVGAAVRARDGRVFTGANVENAAYPLSTCAERAAVVAAAGAGARDLEAVAIATGHSPPSSPCGACRQILAEFARDMVVLLVNDRGERVRCTLAELLPRAFRGEELP